MSTLSIPNTFSPGTTALSALVNGNFLAISSWASGIDFKALSIQPSSANTVAIVVNSQPSPTANIADFQLNGTTVVSVDKGGALVFGYGSSITNSTVAIVNDGAGTNGMSFNVPSGSTNGWIFNVGGEYIAQIASNGNFYGFAFNGSGFSAGLGGFSTTETNLILTNSSTGTAGQINFGNSSSSLEYGYVSHSGYSAPSARRMKRDIDYPVVDSLSEIERMNLRSFHWSGDSEGDPLTHGFIADELPESVAAVNEDGEAVGWKTAVALAFALDAIKKLKSEVDDLKRGVNR